MNFQFISALAFSPFFFFQEQNIELREKVKNLTESEEDQQRALRALEQASVKMETEKIKQHTEAVRLS